MVHLSVYIPKESLEKVKTAMFQAGAGRIGNYDCCSFDIKGLGQFRPLKGSNPYLGEENNLEFVEEVKVEMVCDENILPAVVAAMKSAHPYETPAYYAIKTLKI